MPTYDFHCTKCGNRFEVICSWQKRDQVSCPQCQSKECRQLITGVGVIGSQGKGFSGAPAAGSSCGPGGGGFT